MRKELGKIVEVRDTFTGVFIRFGSKNGWRGILPTILLSNICDKNNKVVSEHSWFNYTKGFSDVKLQEGDLIQFDARVKKYIKGYKGYRDDVDEHPIEVDYKLNFPTKISILIG